MSSSFCVFIIITELRASLIKDERSSDLQSGGVPRSSCIILSCQTFFGALRRSALTGPLWHSQWRWWMVSPWTQFLSPALDFPASDSFHTTLKLLYSFIKNLSSKMCKSLFSLSELSFITIRFPVSFYPVTFTFFNEAYIRPDRLAAGV